VQYCGCVHLERNEHAPEVGFARNSGMIALEPGEDHEKKNVMEPQLGFLGEKGDWMTSEAPSLCLVGSIVVLRERA
jgi:hypothetical protein